MDPLPEPKRDRGMLRCLEAEGRCWSDCSIWTQGDEEGSLVGVWSSSSSSVAKRWPFMTEWQSKECWSQGSRRAADSWPVGCDEQQYSRWCYQRRQGICWTRIPARSNQRVGSISEQEGEYESISGVGTCKVMLSATRPREGSLFCAHVKLAFVSGPCSLKAHAIFLLPMQGSQ